MTLVSKRGNWHINQISTGAPYRVEPFAGNPIWGQVVDSRGTVALSNWVGDRRTGAVFTTITKAKRLCALANEGRIKSETEVGL